MDRMVAEVVLREREDEARKADQEIRARALECTTRLYARNWYEEKDEEKDVDACFWEDVHALEAYIRDG